MIKIGRPPTPGFWFDNGMGLPKCPGDFNGMQGKGQIMDHLLEKFLFMRETGICTCHGHGQGTEYLSFEFQPLDKTGAAGISS